MSYFNRFHSGTRLFFFSLLLLAVESSAFIQNDTCKWAVGLSFGPSTEYRKLTDLKPNSSSTFREKLEYPAKGYFLDIPFEYRFSKLHFSILSGLQFGKMGFKTGPVNDSIYDKQNLFEVVPHTYICQIPYAGLSLGLKSFWHYKRLGIYASGGVLIMKSNFLSTARSGPLPNNQYSWSPGTDVIANTDMNLWNQESLLGASYFVKAGVSFRMTDHLEITLDTNYKYCLTKAYAFDESPGYAQVWYNFYSYGFTLGVQVVF
jgi:hypothetical protein